MPSSFTCSDNGPICPYCDRKFVPDEPHYYDEINFTEMDCDECGKKFTVEVLHSVIWTCETIEDTDTGTKPESGAAADPAAGSTQGRQTRGPNHGGGSSG